MQRPTVREITPFCHIAEEQRATLQEIVDAEETAQRLADAAEIARLTARPYRHIRIDPR